MEGASQMVMEVLSRVRAQLTSPEDWTQGAVARDAGGYKVDVFSPSAVSRCLDGWLIAVTGEDVEAYWGARCFLETRVGYIPEFNDTHTFAEVVAVLTPTAVGEVIG